MDLVAENLVFRPENEYHLNNVSFSMTRGKLYTILGRTLAGKTTLLKTIAGLIAPDAAPLRILERIWFITGLETKRGDGLPAIYQLPPLNSI